MRSSIGLCVLLLTTPIGVSTQDSTPRPEAPVEPDRPDLTNSAHLVKPGILQLEVGALYTRESSDHRAFSSPLTTRLGVRDWFEARLGFDGVLTESEATTRVTGIGNVQLGAKIRVLADAGGVGLVSILPMVNLPTASAEKGLGSGEPDYSVTVATGTDLGERAHVDVNYSVGAIGVGEGASHFSQQVGSASVSFAATSRWNPYVEVFRISRQRPHGSAVTALDTGAVCTIGTHMAIDGGTEFGLSPEAPGFTVFGGFTVALGHAQKSSTRAHSDSLVAGGSWR